MKSEQNELPDVQEYNNYNDFEKYFTQNIDDHLKDVQKNTSDVGQRDEYLHHFNMKHFLNTTQETTKQTDQGDIDNIKQQIKKNMLTLHQQYFSPQKSFKASCKIDRPKHDTIKNIKITIAMENNDDDKRYQIIYKSSGIDPDHKYTKGIFNNEQHLTQGHYRAMSWCNTEAFIANGTWFPTENSSIHTSGTYIVIKRDKKDTNVITIDICYNYKNDNAPDIKVGGGDAFRITLTQKEGKYTLNSIKKGNMKEDKVDDTSLTDVQTLDIRGIIDNEEQGKSLRKTLAEEPELCKVLQEAKVISQEQYEQIMPKNTIEEKDNDELKEAIKTTSTYELLCLSNSFVGKDKTTGKYGCCGFNCC